MNVYSFVLRRQGHVRRFCGHRWCLHPVSLPPVEPGCHSHRSAAGRTGSFALWLTPQGYPHGDRDHQHFRPSRSAMARHFEVILTAFQLSFHTPSSPLPDSHSYSRRSQPPLSPQIRADQGARVGRVAQLVERVISILLPSSASHRSSKSWNSILDKVFGSIPNSSTVCASAGCPF